MEDSSSTALSLARLICEQARLVSKEASLTDTDKCDFRARAKKICLLLSKQRRGATKNARLLHLLRKS